MLGILKYILYIIILILIVASLIITLQNAYIKQLPGSILLSSNSVYRFYASKPKEIRKIFPLFAKPVFYARFASFSPRPNECVIFLELNNNENLAFLNLNTGITTPVLREGGDTLKITNQNEGDEFTFPSISPNSDTILFFKSWNNIHFPYPQGEIFIIKSHKNIIKLTSIVCLAAAKASWAPDSKVFIFSSINSEIIKINIEKPLEYATIRRGINPVFSPNGKLIAYVSGANICICDENGLNERIIVTNYDHFASRNRHSNPTQIAWSPDGKYLLYQRESQLPLPIPIPQFDGIVVNINNPLLKLKLWARNNYYSSIDWK